MSDPNEEQKCGKAVCAYCHSDIPGGCPRCTPRAEGSAAEVKRYDVELPDGYGLAWFEVVLAADYDAACAERANAIASAHDATLRAQRLHEERTALAARVERLEGALREAEQELARVYVSVSPDAPGGESCEETALRIIRAALAEREYAAPSGSLSPQAEKEPPPC